MNNLRNITTAIQWYEMEHGHLPPAYTVDADGNPLHSWRVLILPYLEKKRLYEALDLTKPWHHPDNLAHESEMPEFYRCPSATPANGDVTTSYLAVVGDRTAWPGSRSRRVDEITDGIGETLLILESEHRRLHWMSTADPDFESIGAVYSTNETLLAGSNHEGCVMSARFNGQVERLESDTPLVELQALLTIDDQQDSDSRRQAKNR